MFALWVFMLAFHSALILNCRCEFVEFQYFRQTLCDVGVRESHNCSVEFSHQSDVVKCVTYCNTDPSCIGASVDDAARCFHHYPCPQVQQGCNTSNTDHLYFSKKCDNGGTYVPSSKSCQCEDSWVGATCRERAKDCNGLLPYGYPAGVTRAVLDPYEDGETLLPAVCAIADSLQFVALMVFSQTGNTNHNLTWDALKNGYFVNANNYFIGLYAWHKFSALGNTQLVIAIDFGSKGVLYRSYWGFNVRGESDHFYFTNGRTMENGRGKILGTGNRFGDCFGPFQNVSFSTWDRDNDLETDDDVSCAKSSGVPWWYEGCDAECNFFGWVADYDRRTSSQLLKIPGIDIERYKDHFTTITIYLQME